MLWAVHLCVICCIFGLKNEHEGSISKEILVKHLKTPPCYTIIRVNTVTTSKEILRDEIKEALLMVKFFYYIYLTIGNIYITLCNMPTIQQYSLKRISPPTVQFHYAIPDILVVKSNHTPEKAEPIYPHVIVGLGCAIAILRCLIRSYICYTFKNNYNLLRVYFLF